MPVYTLEQIHKRLVEGLPLDNEEGYDLLNYYLAMKQAFVGYLQTYRGYSYEQAKSIVEKEFAQYS